MTERATVYLSIGDVARCLGLKPAGVESRWRRPHRPDHIRRIPLTEHRYVYELARDRVHPGMTMYVPGPHGFAVELGVSADDPDAADAPVDEVDTEVEGSLRADMEVEGWQERGKYIYDGDRDAYIFSTERGPTIVDGTTIRAAWKTYVAGATQAEIERNFSGRGIDAFTWPTIKSALRLTRRRGPHTWEEIASKDEETLVDEVVAEKERKVYQKAQAKDWRRTKQLAERGLRREWLVEHIANAELKPLRPLPPVQTQQRPATRDDVWLIGTTDLHVGKRYHGSTMTLENQVDHLLGHLWRVTEIIQERGTPARFVTIIGSDGLHSDGYHQTTTAGTVQGPQSLGSAYQQFDAYNDLIANYFARLAAFAPVEAIVLPGNHDRFAAHASGRVLEARLAHHEITVEVAEATRRVLPVGDIPVGLTHGDALHPNGIGPWLMRECPAGCDVSKAVVFEGHWHQTSKRSSTKREGMVGSVPVWTLGSPSGTDDWHEQKGYVSLPTIDVHFLRPGYGWLGMQQVRATQRAAA